MDPERKHVLSSGACVYALVQSLCSYETIKEKSAKRCQDIPGNAELDSKSFVCAKRKLEGVCSSPKNDLVLLQRGHMIPLKKEATQSH